jgi:hypothetical protein
MFNNQLIVEQKIAYVMAPSLATGATHEPQEPCISAYPPLSKRPETNAGSFTRSLNGMAGTLWRPMRTQVSQGPRVATNVLALIA